MAVATPKGLVTPIIRNVESMSFLDFEKALTTVGKKARDGKLTLEDMTGGSFTISNGGVFGSLFGTPIINMPQAAVLGMHAVKDKAVVVKGEIVVRPVMVVALTYDHRLLDGREAVTFLGTFFSLTSMPCTFVNDQPSAHQGVHRRPTQDAARVVLLGDVWSMSMNVYLIYLVGFPRLFTSRARLRERRRDDSGLPCLSRLQQGARCLDTTPPAAVCILTSPSILNASSLFELAFSPSLL